MKNKLTNSCSTFDMIIYSSGEFIFSLVNNSITVYSAIYYTEALGLRPVLAGTVIFISILWDAISDPIMGVVSDNTRSRFGKRLPYIFVGGLALVISFYFLWNIPEIFKENNAYLFSYLVIITLILRTTFTVFLIPYIALGFEICTDYTKRAKLQGIRLVMDMIPNFWGIALGWYIFFGGKEGLRIADNFENMGTIFSITILGILLFLMFGTFRYVKDSRSSKIQKTSIKLVITNIKEIIFDKYSCWIFACAFFAIAGCSFVGSLQGYVYEYFLKFDGITKFCAHGLGMFLTAFGGVAASGLVKRFDKKGAVCIGIILCIIACVILSILFLPGIIKPKQGINFMGIMISPAFLVFSLIQGSYWMGNGVLFAVFYSMIADVSEIDEIRNCINRDGTYSSGYTFITKLAASCGILMSMLGLEFIGFKTGELQNQAVFWRLGLISMIGGPIFSLLSLFCIKRYPVTESLLDKIRLKDKIQTI